MCRIDCSFKIISFLYLYRTISKFSYHLNYKKVTAARYCDSYTMSMVNYAYLCIFFIQFALIW